MTNDLFANKLVTYMVDHKHMLLTKSKGKIREEKRDR